MKTIDSLADLQKVEIYIYKELLRECNNAGVKLYSYSKSRLVSTNVDNGSQKEVVEKILFEKGVEVEFENTSSKAFSCYKAFLESYYGDYMTPPPIEQQKPKHGICAEIEDLFNLEKSFIV